MAEAKYPTQMENMHISWEQDLRDLISKLIKASASLDYLFRSNTNQNMEQELTNLLS